MTKETIASVFEKLKERLKTEDKCMCEVINAYTGDNKDYGQCDICDEIDQAQKDVDKIHRRECTESFAKGYNECWDDKKSAFSQKPEPKTEICVCGKPKILVCPDGEIMEVIHGRKRKKKTN